MTDERQPGPEEDRREFAEEAESLWRITFAPVIWAVHLILVYGFVSVSCVRGLLPIGPTRAALVAASVAALVAIAWLGWRSLRQWNVRETGRFTHPEGNPESRHEFLGHAAFLLSAISFIGVVFVTLPLLLIGSCR